MGIAGSSVYKITPKWGFLHSDLHFSVCRREIRLTTRIFMGLQDLLPLKQPKMRIFALKPQFQSWASETKENQDLNPAKNLLFHGNLLQIKTSAWRFSQFPNFCPVLSLGILSPDQEQKIWGKKDVTFGIVFFFHKSRLVQFLWSLRDGNRNKYLWWEGRGFGLGKRKKQNNFIPDFFFIVWGQQGEEFLAPRWEINATFNPHLSGHQSDGKIIIIMLYFGYFGAF